LHFAAAKSFSQANIIPFLLTKTNSSLINIQNYKKQTPLHIAVLNNNENAVQELLVAGKTKTQFRF